MPDVDFYVVSGKIFFEGLGKHSSFTYNSRQLAAVNIPQWLRTLLKMGRT